MLGFRIWGIAQLLNILLCTFSLNMLNIISIPFALFGGLPAIILFNIWLYPVRKLKLSGWPGLIICLIALPASMALLSFGLRYLMDDIGNELLSCAILPVVATVISVVIHHKEIMYMAEYKDYNEEQ